MNILTKSIRKYVKVCKSIGIWGMADAHTFTQFLIVSQENTGFCGCPLW